MTELHPIDPNLLTRVKQLLLPHVKEVDDREMLLTEAFYIRERTLYYAIAREGRPDQFAVRCAQTLLDKGCLPDKTHALSALLQAVHPLCGVAGQIEIEHLVHTLDDACIEAPAVDRSAGLAPAPARGQPTQTVDTPAAQRTSTVFVCYSHADTDMAQRLLADLQAAGHACWIDTSSIKGGDEWRRAICEGINNSHTALILCSRAALASRWVQDEILWAREKKKHIVPLLLEDVLGDDAFFGLHTYQAIALYDDYAAGLHALLAALPTPGDVVPPATRGALPRRALELEYLDRLRLEELLNTEHYTPLAGAAEVAGPARRGARLQPVVMRPEFEHMPWSREREPERVTRRFENAVEELLKIRRAAVLGEPGAGKSTTLWRLASYLVDAALQDAQAPLPLLIRLGKWTDPAQPAADFIAAQLGELGRHMAELLRERRAALLLDGLNEVPASQRAGKTQQVQVLLASNPDLLAVVTCRAQDYTVDLALDRVSIAPLDPLRILEFVTRYLGQAGGERLFWKLAGGDDLQRVWEKWQHAGASLTLFFEAADVPRKEPNVYSATSGADDELWRRQVRASGSLMALARNPYMLLMLTQVFVDRQGELPANRGLLFDGFVETLLLREHIAERDPITHAMRLSAEAQELVAGLQRLAFEMQMQRGDSAESREGATAAPMAQARRLLGERGLYLAGSASILSLGEEVRFTHQLLQEYFAARRMKGEVDAGHLRAAGIWKPGRWWEHTNWEETTILLAGLYSDDCTPALDWVMDANPEVAARCMVESGAHAPDAARLRLRERWLSQLSDVRRQPSPYAREAIGRALGLATLNGQPLDNRTGVGIPHPSSPSGGGGWVGVPDIDWVLIPDEGQFVFGDKSQKNGPHQLRLPSFRIGRYPVTYAQFQLFMDAADGFASPKWWAGLAANDEHRHAPGEQYFKYANHPCDTVSWYDAVAFCRWLSERLGEEVRLPTEWEWEKAARGRRGQVYPWGNEYVEGYANIAGEHYLQSTSAVGIYPQGASPYGVLDMCGNVWEWCLNEYDHPNNIQLAGDQSRVVRGGSWNFDRGYARAAYRYGNRPYFRGYNCGFRVVSGSAPVLPL